MANQMAIKQKSHQKIKITLTNPQKNIYYLLGTAEAFAKQLNLDDEAILEEMQESDYENLITVFDKHFGDYVDLVR